MLLQKCLNIWFLNKERECWMSPPHGCWQMNDKSVNNELVDNKFVDNKLVDNNVFFTKPRWLELLRESDINLQKEDDSKNVIMGFYKGYLARKYVNENKIMSEYIIC